METSIRFVRIEKRAIKPVLCFRGRNQAYVVLNDTSIIRVVSNVPLRDLDNAPIVMGPAGLGQTVYPISLFVERYMKMGETKPMTERAKFMLQKALNGGVKDDECLPPDKLAGAVDSPEPDDRADEKERTRAPAAPKPGKPAVAPIKRAAGASEPARTAGADIVRKLAAELKLEPTKLRKLLRSKGLSAPYTDEKLIRSKLG